MLDQLCIRPLLDLIKQAMDCGVISGWSVEGPHLVLLRNTERIALRPLTAGPVLREWISQASLEEAAA